jgi:hypothetical protein
MKMFSELERSGDKAVKMETENPLIKVTNVTKR